MPDDRISIFWFRQDLRLSDNPGLKQAASSGKVLAVYICDEVNACQNAMGAATKWWTHQSLSSLNRSLGHRLNFYRGDPVMIIRDLVKRYGVRAVYWNRCYEPWRVSRDKKIKVQLRTDGLRVESFNSSLLWEPWNVFTRDGNPYRVFTPFYHRGCLTASPPRQPLGPLKKLTVIRDDQALALDALELLPRIRWDRQLEPHWQTGEEGARKRLSDFLADGLEGYRDGRSCPARRNVSRLSPCLHSGEISPHQIWHAVRALGDNQDIQCFCTELAWREFSYNQLYHFPALPDENMREKFNDFPWRNDAEALERWQKGLTGYPLVDAGMRELWQTGYMHNRVRMVAASFLIKNLLIDWRLGAGWFLDCLVDADLANNSAGWQWVAGSGIDAAPFFRIFNPVAQGEKFDGAGTYTRKYVPEIAGLPDAYLFRPWLAPENILKGAGIIPGKTYPLPVVDPVSSRERALEAFSGISGSVQM